MIMTSANNQPYQEIEELDEEEEEDSLRNVNEEENSNQLIIEEEKESNYYTGLGNTDTGGLADQVEINELDAKHDYYADELEKIKAMLK